MMAELEQPFLDHEEGNSAQGHCGAAVSGLDSLCLKFIDAGGKASSVLLKHILGEVSGAHS